MDSELTALTSAAATTVVPLLATAAWERVTCAMGRLWRRVHPERAETMPAELVVELRSVLADAASSRVPRLPREPRRSAAAG